MIKNLLIALFLFPFFCFSQGQSIEELETEVNSSNWTDLDSIKVKKYYKLAWTFSQTNVDKSIAYSKKGFELAKQIGFDRFLYVLKVTDGTTYQLAGKMDESIQSLKEGLQYANNINYEKGILTARSTLLNTYYLKGDFKTASKLAYDNINYMKSIGNTAFIGDAYNIIAACYIEMKNHEKAIQYFELYANFSAKNNDPEAQAVAYINIFETLVKLKKIENAKQYLQKAKKLVNKSFTLSTLNSLKSSEADLLAAENKNTEAEMIRKSLVVEKNQSSNPRFISEQNRKMAIAFYDKNNLDSALYYALKAKALAENFSLLNEQIINAEILSNIYIAKGNFKEAYNQQINLKILSDSIMNLGIKKEFLDLQEKYETKIKDDKNKQLELEKTNKTKQLKLSILLGITVVSIISFFAFLMYKNKRKVEKLNAQITQQKIELEKSNLFKDELFSIISHDLRSPLTNLQTLLFIKNKGLSPKVLEAHNAQIQQSLSNTSALLENLLLWSTKNLETDINIKKEELLPIVIQAIQDVKIQSELKQVSINILQELDTIFVNVHYSKFLFCLRNVLSNAIKFSYSDSEITISFIENVLTIKDTGKGMSHQQKTALERGDNTIANYGTNEEKGTGIGMRLAFQFCKAQKIEMRIFSEEDKGTEVRFLFN